MPEQDAVIAITGAMKDMQIALNLVWEHLLPAMTAGTLPPNEEAQASLTDKLARLALLPLPKSALPPLAAKVSGKRYKLEENAMNMQTTSFAFHEESCTVTLQGSRGEDLIPCGYGDWIEGNPNRITSPWLVVASGNWQDEHTFVMIWRYPETPFYDTVTCRFTEVGGLTLEISRDLFIFEKDPNLTVQGYETVEQVR